MTRSIEESGSGSESSSTSAVAEPLALPLGQSITPCPAGMNASTRSAVVDHAEIGRREAEAEHARAGVGADERSDDGRKMPRHHLPDRRGVEIPEVDDVEVHGALFPPYLPARIADGALLANRPHRFVDHPFPGFFGEMDRPHVRLGRNS